MALRNRVFEPSRTERFDKYLFVFVFLAGLTWILVGKSTGLSWFSGVVDEKSTPFIVAGGTLALMAVYTLLCTFLRLFQVREDVLGDNVYYLGFLFTLVSLAYALWEIDLEKQDDLIEDLVSSFGVALSSTIAGIFIRVLVLQFRKDPAEFERQMRLELIEATDLLKTNMLGAIERFDSAIVQMAQLLTESTEIAVNEQRKAIATSSSAFTEELQSLCATIENGIKTPIIATATDMSKAAARLKKQSDSLETQIGVSVAKLNDGCQNVAQALADAATEVRNASEAFSGDIKHSTIEILKMTDDVKRHAAESSNRLNEIGGGVTAAIESIGSATTKLMSRLEETLVQGGTPGNSIERQDIDRIVDKLSEISREIRSAGTSSPIQTDPYRFGRAAGQPGGGNDVLYGHSGDSGGAPAGATDLGRGSPAEGDYGRGNDTSVREDAQPLPGNGSFEPVEEEREGGSFLNRIGGAIGIRRR